MTLPGIDETAVHAAARALIREGESPTGEAVVARIGGSKTTVYKYLRTFWPRLAEELDADTRIPDLPDSVAQLAAGLWTAAVAEATKVARATLAQALRAAEDAKERAEEAVDGARKVRAEAEARVEAADRAVEAMKIDRDAALADARQTRQDLARLTESLAERTDELRQARRESEIRSEALEALKGSHLAEIERINADRDREAGLAMSQLDAARTEARKGAQALKAELDAMRTRLDHSTKQQLDQAREIASLQASLSAAGQALQAERTARRALEAKAVRGITGDPAEPAASAPSGKGFSIYPPASKR